MLWNWSARQSVKVGGGAGTVQEAASTTTWPNYEATYLAKRLNLDHKAAERNRYSVQTADDSIKQLAYYNKITDNYKEDADECLKREFIDWLQGAHEDNVKQEASKNTRKAIFYKDGKVPGDEIEDWKPTWWGRHQLTHLPGVRPFLRNIRQNAAEQEFLLQQMAEFGPQNIEQAWQYFKYWVKGRQLGPEECVTPSYGHDPGFAPIEGKDTKQAYGPVQRSTPIHMAKTREQILYPRQESRKRRMEEESAAEAMDVAQSNVAAASAAVNAASFATAANMQNTATNVPKSTENELRQQATVQVETMEESVKAAAATAAAANSSANYEEETIRQADETVEQVIDDSVFGSRSEFQEGGKERRQAAAKAKAQQKRAEKLNAERSKVDEAAQSVPLQRADSEETINMSNLGAAADDMEGIYDETEEDIKARQARRFAREPPKPRSRSASRQRGDEGTDARGES